MSSLLPIRRALVFAAALSCGAAFAAGMPFAKPAFDAAIADGKPVAIAFHADWCPTCKAQKPVVDRLLNEPKFAGLTLYVADFDRETALKQQMKVTTQSTIVVFKGGHEVGRSTGQTDEAAIGALLSKAL